MNAFSIPELLRRPDTPVLYVDCAGLDLGKAAHAAKAAQALGEAVAACAGAVPARGVLMKVHTGEPKCRTRMRPGFVAACARALRARGARGIAAGDTTVAYTGRRGARSNPPGDCSAYRSLAEQHGWSVAGEAGVPFVVLDRPETAAPRVLEFDEEEVRVELEGVRRFSDFFLSGGFAAAELTVNHAHLTLHGLAGFAGCVKSLAMGCTSLTGKLRMHQSLHPDVDPERCTACGLCVDNCPEAALTLAEGASTPAVDATRCIGCGECVSVCPRKAMTLKGAEIDDWSRGAETISQRMADYTIGLMQDRWERAVHVLHMVDVTALCDCVDRVQRPLFEVNPGFLVGRNPFAVDRWGAELTLRLAGAAGAEAGDPLRQAMATEQYVRDGYGIAPAPTVQVVQPA